MAVVVGHLPSLRQRLYPQMRGKVAPDYPDDSPMGTLTAS